MQLSITNLGKRYRRDFWGLVDHCCFYWVGKAVAELMARQGFFNSIYQRKKALVKDSSISTNHRILVIRI